MSSINSVEDRVPGRTTPSKRYKGAFSMCIYCTTTNYRKIYENHHGVIPKDHQGRSYHIHHIDGNHNNNDPGNLQAVSVEDHYQIHLDQGDLWAAIRLASLLEISAEERSRLSKEVNAHMKETGKHPFVGGEMQRRTQRVLVESGRHNLLDGTMSRENALRRAREGTHNLQGSTHNERMIREGRHANFIKVTCPHCRKTGSKPGMMKSHFDKCKFKNLDYDQFVETKRMRKQSPRSIANTKISQEAMANGKNPWSIKLKCPHCGTTGNKGNIARWHGDKCKKK